MELSRSVHHPPVSHSLSAAQEAAVLYASGRELEAAEFLRSVIHHGETGPGSREPWYMLFDLLRVRGEWKAFEALSARFEAAFAVPAPQWLNEEEMERLPAELRPGGPGYFELGGALNANRGLDLDRMRAAARNLATVHLDVSRLAAIDSGGCAALLALMRFMPENGNGLLLTGAEHFVDMLREATEGNPSDEAYWGLLLELHRVRRQQADFERTALEYALAVGVTPPVWESVLMPLAPQPTPQEKRDEPRYQAGPEVIYLTGVMWGAADPQIAEVHAFGAEREYVNINLSQLRRIDFSCATVFASLVNGLAADGRIVRLIRPNSLVGAFLDTLSLDPAVKLIPVQRPDH
jgi:ABC-type transporter Mla MlaB component